MKDSSTMIKSFQDNIQKSKDECENKLEEIRDLGYNFFQCFGSFVTINTAERFKDSLVFWLYVESTEISVYTLYLSYCGLYRNAFDNIRHVLESIVQSLYIDVNHPNTSLLTKLEILKEIEDKKEYHASRLLQEKLSFKSDFCEGLDCKGALNASYKKLSKMVHPSHEKVIATIHDAMSSTKNRGLSELVDCGEVARVFESMKIVYDVFYVLVLMEFPDFLPFMKNDEDFVACVKKYELSALGKVLSSTRVTSK
jgi:hypothetical protein